LVLRHALAVVIHSAEVELRLGDALVGQRTKEPKRGSIVAATIGGHPILKRPCDHWSGKAHGQKKKHEAEKSYSIPD
jgi:hypothetical protein